MTSGIRIGSAAITTRGLLEDDMEQLIDLLDKVIQYHDDEKMLEQVASDVNEMMAHRPLFVM